jgi:arabinose-5-phosphate isomerase
MHRDDEIPLVNDQQPLADALVEMSSKGLGMTGVINDRVELVGIYTDGDLRRSLAASHSLETPINKIMSSNPITVKPDVLAAELVALMKEKRIGSILVTDGRSVVGALNMQDLLRAGVL